MTNLELKLENYQPITLKALDTEEEKNFNNYN